MARSELLILFILFIIFMIRHRRVRCQRQAPAPTELSNTGSDVQFKAEYIFTKLKVKAFIHPLSVQVDVSH